MLKVNEQNHTDTKMETQNIFKDVIQQRQNGGLISWDDSALTAAEMIAKARVVVKWG